VKKEVKTVQSDKPDVTSKPVSASKDEKPKPPVEAPPIEAAEKPSQTVECFFDDDDEGDKNDSEPLHFNLSDPETVKKLCK